MSVEAAHDARHESWHPGQGAPQSQKSYEMRDGLAIEVATNGLEALDRSIGTSTAVGRVCFQIVGAIAEFEHGAVCDVSTGAAVRIDD